MQIAFGRVRRKPHLHGRVRVIKGRESNSLWLGLRNETMNGLPTTNGRVKVIKGREFGLETLPVGIGLLNNCLYIFGLYYNF